MTSISVSCSKHEISCHFALNLSVAFHNSSSSASMSGRFSILTRASRRCPAFLEGQDKYDLKIGSFVLEKKIHSLFWGLSQPRVRASLNHYIRTSFGRIFLCVCSKIMMYPLKIIDRHSTMLWKRFETFQEFFHVHTLFRYDWVNILLGHFLHSHSLLTIHLNLPREKLLVFRGIQQVQKRKAKEKSRKFKFLLTDL